MSDQGHVTLPSAEQFRSLKEKVDDLQDMVRKGRPWYQNPSTIISIVALMLSFGTTYLGHARNKAQDTQNLRVELRGLLQRLAYLPREGVEVMNRYAGNPGAAASVAGFLNQENAMLARHAAEIVRRLPEDAVSATEYYAVATALQFSYNNEGAKEFFSKAIASSKEFNDKVAALRAYGSLLFIVGQAEAGRVEYSKALDIFSTFAGYNEETKLLTHAYTEMQWAFSEAGINERVAALQHLEKAEAIAARLYPGQAADQFRQQLQQARASLQARAAGSAALPAAVSSTAAFVQ